MLKTERTTATGGATATQETLEHQGTPTAGTQEGTDGTLLKEGILIKHIKDTSNTRDNNNCRDVNNIRDSETLETPVVQMGRQQP
jgi:hypothetical protein